MKRIFNAIEKLTNHPIYQLLVSISLITVSIYDSIKVILRDVTSLHMRKEHFIILVGILMLINAINSLLKGVKGMRKSVETLEERHAREEQDALEAAKKQNKTA